MKRMIKSLLTTSFLITLFLLSNCIASNDEEIAIMQEHFKHRNQNFSTGYEYIVAIQSKSGNIFSQDSINLIGKLTQLGWSQENVVRVQSITNFHRTFGNDDGDFFVEKLIKDHSKIKKNELSKIKEYVLKEPELLNNLISLDGSVSLIVYTLRSFDLEGVKKISDSIEKVFLEYTQKKCCVYRIGGRNVISYTDLTSSKFSYLSFYNKNWFWPDIFQMADFKKKTGFPGINVVEYGISTPNKENLLSSYQLKKIERFTKWLRKQENVLFVESMTDKIKRINMALNNNDVTHYRIPENDKLIKQGFLLYALSLPYGIDLFNQINIDNTSIKIKVILEKNEQAFLKGHQVRVFHWLVKNNLMNTK